MTDNENKCPLCGKDTNAEEVFCRNCQEIAKNTYSEDFLYYTEVSELITISSEDDLEVPVSLNIDGTEVVPEHDMIDPIPPAPPVKSNRKWIIFLIIGLILLVIIGGISSYIFIQNKNAEETEIAYWNKCIEENTPLSYSKYLVQYPDGKYSVEAQVKIVTLREEERNEWQKLRNSKNIDALFAFLTDHPQTPYQREIKRVIDSLGWLQTTEQNTTAAYQAYMDNVKIGRYAGEYESVARQKYDYLSQMKVVEGDELKEVKETVEGFFKALSSIDNKDIQKYSAPVLKQLYKTENQESKNIVDSVKATFKTKKIKEISYALPDTLPEVIKDNKGIYFVSVPVKSETVFTDKKKKKVTTEQVVNIELDAQKLVQALYIKEK
ncbi:hypothetical protein [Prevotella sp. 10(H)]|uniref:hypothetical protein n=1 Tax=Prevotella sp. 10(H) TaxID=1158294 RepID=UPI0004A6B10C|nr:hypothetical protein [Prevotella sp. 10(H)]